MTDRIGMTALGLLIATMVSLKLYGVIDWSWWLVTLPLWAPFAFILGGCVVLGGVVLRAGMIGTDAAARLSGG